MLVSGMAIRVPTPNVSLVDLTAELGTAWRGEGLSFKPYPCGTMTHPYIDCARRLAARGVKPSIGIEQYGSFDAIEEISFAVPVISDRAPYQPLYDVFAH